MRRALAAVVLGFAATLAACGVLWWVPGLDEPGHPLGYAVGLGGVLGTLLSGFSAGAQVALLEKRPQSNASLGAMVVGFFAKLSVLAAGILLLRAIESPWSPTAFGVSFFLASALVAAIALSALVDSPKP